MGCFRRKDRLIIINRMALPPRGEAIWENPEFFLRIFPYG